MEIDEIINYLKEILPLSKIMQEEEVSLVNALFIKRPDLMSHTVSLLEFEDTIADFSNTQDHRQVAIELREETLQEFHSNDEDAQVLLGIVNSVRDRYYRSTSESNNE